jgi:hypothetical protein
VLPKVVADQWASKPHIEDVVKEYAEKNPQKLRQIGLNHDIANSKAITTEEVEKVEKKVKEENEKAEAKKEKKKEGDQTVTVTVQIRPKHPAQPGAPMPMPGSEVSKNQAIAVDSKSEKKTEPEEKKKEEGKKVEVEKKEEEKKPEVDKDATVDGAEVQNGPRKFNLHPIITAFTDSISCRGCRRKYRCAYYRWRCGTDY